MSHYLPPAILAFFAPRPPLEHKNPLVHRKMPPLSGMAQFVGRFKDPMPEPVVNQTPQEIKEKRKAKRLLKAQEKLNRQIAKWDPNTLADGTGDAMKTLFVGRLARDITEQDIKEEFEYYGNIVKVKIIKDSKTGSSRGYGFVEFESSRDLKEAYKDADGRKIHNRRILVDVERGRTVKNWRPRRLGGGMGQTRVGGKDQNQRYSGRQPPPGQEGTSRPPRSRDREDRGGGRDRDRDRGKPPASGGRDRGRDRDRGDRDKDRGDRDKGGDRDKDRGKERDRGEKRARSKSAEKEARSGSRDRKRRR